MEIDCRDEFAMTFSCHDVFSSVDVPNFPSAVVRGGRDDLLTHVECSATNGSVVSINILDCLYSLVKWIVGTGQEWVWARIFRVGCVFFSALSKCALTERVLVFLEAFPLSLMGRFDLLLDSLFVCFDLVA